MNYYSINLIEACYIYYMFNKFKTIYNFNHPLEYFIISNSSNYFQHPISSSEYENKICPFGKLCGKLFVFFFLYRILYYKIYNKKEYYLSKIVFFISLILSLIMNMNAFIYLLPYFILELFYIKLF